MRTDSLSLKKIRQRKLYEGTKTSAEVARKTIIARRSISLFVILSFFILNLNFVFAPFSDFSLAQSNPVSELQQSLESQLQEVLKQIDELGISIDNLQKQGKTLSNEIAILDNNIKKIQLQIKATQLAIKELNSRIADTGKAIDITKDDIERSQDILARSLRGLDYAERKSLLEILLQNNQLSDFFSQIVYLNNIQENMKQELATLRGLKTTLQNQQDRLEAEKEEQAALLAVQRLKNQEVARARSEKQNLLSETKGKEANYQKLLAEQQKTANEIRAQIYRLAGGAGEITFGEALKYAELAGGSTGVRPAFLLAVLDYESKIGKNVGTCNYSQSMKPSERTIFEQITNELGFNPMSMPVSCKQWYGWGGAMGPAQFIPSTWMIYRDKVAELTGHNPPSPWNIIDSFVAAAVYLTQLGADKKTSSAEWTAAMKYFAGANWWKNSLRFYGDDVIAIARRYQSDIDALKQAENTIRNLSFSGGHATDMKRQLQ